jgi:hypothetical protein
MKSWVVSRPMTSTATAIAARGSPGNDRLGLPLPFSVPANAQKRQAPGEQGPKVCGAGEWGFFCRASSDGLACAISEVGLVVRRSGLWWCWRLLAQPKKGF